MLMRDINDLVRNFYKKIKNREICSPISQIFYLNPDDRQKENLMKKNKIEINLEIMKIINQR